ncbi:MAG: amidohydrolase family protein [Lachnospiraceae bacterium]|nr:amidohydrolase family protein [Lachnospiraceae bacterium]
MSKILIKAKFTLTEKNNEQVVLKDSYVGITDDKITYVGNEKPSGYEDAILLDRPYGFVIPGLIDLHYHSDSPANKGFCEDCGTVKMDGSILYEYLTAIYSATTEEEWKKIANLTFLEMICGGITTCVEFNSYYPEKMAELLGECGLRGYIAPETNSLDGFPYSPDGEHVIIEHKKDKDMFKKLERNCDLIEKYNGTCDDRIRVTLGPTEPPACRPELLKEVRKLSATYKVPITMHAAETKIEREYIKNEYGKDSIFYLYENGIVGPDVILAHTVYANEEEKKLLAETKTNVAHCPSVFVIRGRYMKSLQHYTDLGINVGIGTDTFPQDMIREMRVATSMSKVADNDFRSAKSELLIKCATKNGAKALNRDDIGCIKVGAKADIAIVDMCDFNTVPVRDPVRVLISCGTSHNVTDTIVNGKILMENKIVKSINKEQVCKEALVATETIWSRIPNLNKLSPLSVNIE